VTIPYEDLVFEKNYIVWKRALWFQI